MEEFRSYITEVDGKTFPVPAAELTSELAAWVNAVELETGPAPDWSDPADANARMDRRQSGQSLYNCIRWVPTEEGEAPKVAYLMAVANMTLSFSDTMTMLEPAFLKWEEYMVEENARADMVAVTMGKGIQQSYKWVDYELDKVLLSSALIGLGASLGVASFIILLSTGSIVLTFLSIFSIGCTEKWAFFFWKIKSRALMEVHRPPHAQEGIGAPPSLSRARSLSLSLALSRSHSTYGNYPDVHNSDDS